MVVRDNPLTVFNEIQVNSSPEMATVALFTYGPTEWVQFAYAPDPQTEMEVIYLQRQMTDDSDPPKTYWAGTIPHIHAAIDTLYNGIAISNDGQQSTFQWTHPGLNASNDDIIHFPDIVKAHLAQIASMAEKFSHQDSILADEYQQFVARVIATSYLNTVGTWADGR